MAFSATHHPCGGSLLPRHPANRSLTRRVLILALCVLGVLAHAATAQAQLSPNNEYRLPMGAYTGDAPMGWVLVIHGGGWSYVGKEAVILTRPWARVFRADGWGTYNVDYRAGVNSFADVTSAYNALRAKVGPDAPICVAGQSAGGQLALMLAAGEGDGVACVISEAGPTDFLNFDDEPAYSSSGQDLESGPDSVMDGEIEPAFGSSSADLWHWSPARVAGLITGPVLLGASTYDPLVPNSQMSDFQQARPQGTQTMLLAGAPSSGATTNFPHASITAAANAQWQAAEQNELAQIAGL